MIALHKSPAIPFLSPFLLQFLHQAQPSAKQCSSGDVRLDVAIIFFNDFHYLNFMPLSLYLYKYQQGRVTFLFL